MTSARQPRSGTTVAVVVSLFLFAAAGIAVAVWQTRDGEPTASPSAAGPATPATSASTPAAEQDAVTKALAAYAGFREAYIAAAAAGDARSADLARYAGDPLLLQTRLALQTQARQGVAYRGRPTWMARATTVNVSTRPYSVTIEDCLDTANWTPVYQATGKPAAAAGTQAVRYLVISIAQRYDDGRWLINQSAADRSRPC